MNNANANTILKALKAKFPKPNPQKIYKISEGYIILAPLIENDLADPYYYVSDDLKEVVHFNMAKIKILLKAIKDGPIWAQGDDIYE